MSKTNNSLLLVRGAQANIYELQNYLHLRSRFHLRVITSHHPLTPTLLPTTKLWSLTDLPLFPYRRQFFNRVLGGEQWLVGLARIAGESDILHTAETYTPYTHQAVELRRRGRVRKLVCTCWETIPHANEKFARLRRWKKEAYRYVDLFHTPTRRAKAALIKEGVPAKKIRVIPYGVDCTRFHPAPHRPSHPRQPLVLTVARQVPEKGLALFRQLSSEFASQARFMWVSDLPHSKLPALYRQADIFLLPSLATSTWEEQYGFALVEAMASGLPIVTTQTGAIPEVLGQAGLIVPSTSSALSEALNTLLLSSLKRRKLGHLARERALFHYDYLRAGRELAALYNKLA